MFQQGVWVTYTVPEDCIPLWSKSQQFQAASFYAAAIQKGFSASESSNLAECYINKQLYKDLQYNKRIEELLQQMLV